MRWTGWTGIATVQVKRVRDDEPFAEVWVRVRNLNETQWLFERPKGVYKRGGGGVHYRLLPDTYRPWFS